MQITLWQHIKNFMQTKYNQKQVYTLAFFLLLLAIAGFAYVKWLPYYAKAFQAQTNHSIGASIIYGGAQAAPAVSFNAAIDYAISYSKSIWKAMVLGLLLGSGIKVLIPSQWVSRWLGRLGVTNIIRGGLLAVPCMMCTCCAAPVAAGMRQNKASVGSVVSWWLSNPLLNPATIVFMGFVLGWGWATFRLVFAIAMVLVISYVAEKYANPNDVSNIDENIKLQDETLSSNILPRANKNTHLLLAWAQEFSSMTIKLLPEYLILVLLLGAARAWLFPVFGADESIVWIFAMALAGMLFVIPTAGEVPVAQAMFALGVGAGPAAALIMTLPAISLPSLIMLRNVFTMKTRLIIAICVVLFGVLAGFVAKLIF